VAVCYGIVVCEEDHSSHLPRLIFFAHQKHSHPRTQQSQSARYPANNTAANASLRSLSQHAPHRPNIAPGRRGCHLTASKLHALDARHENIQSLIDIQTAASWRAKLNKDPFGPFLIGLPWWKASSDDGSSWIGLSTELALPYLFRTPLSDFGIISTMFRFVSRKERYACVTQASRAFEFLVPGSWFNDDAMVVIRPCDQKCEFKVPVFG
jgi:hypothetical protein